MLSSTDYRRYGEHPSGCNTPLGIQNGTGSPRVRRNTFCACAVHATIAGTGNAGSGPRSYECHCAAHDAPHAHEHEGQHSSECLHGLLVLPPLKAGLTPGTQQRWSWKGPCPRGVNPCRPCTSRLHHWQPSSASKRCRTVSSWGPLRLSPFK